MLRLWFVVMALYLLLIIAGNRHDLFHPRASKPSAAIEGSITVLPPRPRPLSTHSVASAAGRSSVDPIAVAAQSTSAGDF